MPPTVSGKLPRERGWTRSPGPFPARSTIPSPSRAGSRRDAPLSAESAAVVDLGSNTARVLIARRGAGAHVEVVDELDRRLALARRLDESGRLPPEALDAVVEAIADFRAVAEGAGARGVRVVGTAAVREARNGPALAKRVAELDVALEVADAPLEGRYAFLGAVYGMPVSSGVLVDLGGGSLDLVRFRDRVLVDTATLPLGTLRARARFLPSDPPTDEEAQALYEWTRKAVRAAGFRRLGKGEALVVTGGAARNLAKIDRARRPRYPVAVLHGYELRRARLHAATESLRSLGSRAGSVPGLNPERADTIVAGALVLSAVADALRTKRLLISGQGLREGVLRDGLGEALPSPAQVREDSVETLLGRFRLADPGRPGRRRDLALAIAAGVDAGLGAALGESLGHAARLLDVGAAIGFYNRHRSAAELALESDLGGFSHRSLAEVAALLRVAEKPAWRIRQLAPLLRAADEAPLRRGAAVLALADELLRREPPRSRRSPADLVSVRDSVLRVRPAGGRAWPPGVISERVREHLGVGLTVVEAGDERRRAERS